MKEDETRAAFDLLALAIKAVVVDSEHRQFDAVAARIDETRRTIERVDERLARIENRLAPPDGGAVFMDEI